MGLPCKYFVASGSCKYGDSCLFDHPTRGGSGGGGAGGASSSSSFSAPFPRAAPEPALPSAGDLFAAHDDLDEAAARPPPSSWAGIFVPPEAALAAWEEAEAAEEEAEAAAAASFRGLPHGDACPTCGRRALHPSDASLRAAHSAECQARAARLSEVAASALVECAICLERVLCKEGCRPSDRRFGLLEGCAHAFCLPCIRSWRGQAAEAAQNQQQQQQPRHSIDVAAALRTCPLCRTPAWFVTPSATWPATDEARREIVATYRRSLARIECRWWDRGRGPCPFGTSCFYLHLDANGEEVPREEGLRFVGDGEGVVKPMSQGAKLSYFIEFAVKRRGGGGGGRR